MEHGQLFAGATLAALDELGEDGGAALAGVGGGESVLRRGLCGECDAMMAITGFKTMPTQATMRSNVSGSPVLGRSVLESRQRIGFNELPDDLCPGEGRGREMARVHHVQAVSQSQPLSAAVYPCRARGQTPVVHSQHERMSRAGTELATDTHVHEEREVLQTGVDVRLRFLGARIASHV